MAQNYGEFFVRRDVFENTMKILNENVLLQIQNIDFSDAKCNLKIPGLDLKITSHRIIITHSKNIQLCFYCELQKIVKHKAKKGGLFGMGNSIHHINFYTLSGKFRLRQSNDKNMRQILQTFQDALLKKQWNVKPTQEQQKQQLKSVSTTTSMYKGGRTIIQSKQQEIQQQEQKFESAFTQKGGLEEMMKYAKEIKEITQFIKDNTQIYKENSSDVDHILESIGCFDIITKDEAGKNYMNQLSNQIYNSICINLFDIYGGIVPLMDIYYFYNKKRGGLNYISAEEIYKACQNFQRIGVNAKISVYSGVKVVESTLLDPKKDFEKDIGQYIGKQGITPEQLCKELNQSLANNNKVGNISLMVARLKLNRYLNLEKLVIDDRIQGSRYFRNCILYGFD